MQFPALLFVPKVGASVSLHLPCGVSTSVPFLVPKIFSFFVLQKVPWEVWVDCDSRKELAGRRNCFQRLGEHGLHRAVHFL